MNLLRLFAAILLLGAGTRGSAQQTVVSPGDPQWDPGQESVYLAYDVDLSRPADHLIAVTITVTGLEQPAIRLLMPAGADPRALDRPARHITGLSASDAGGFAVAVRQPALGVWECDTRGISELVVTYTYYANDPSPYSVQLTSRHAYLHPAAILLHLPDLADRPLSVRLALPEGWQAAVALTPSFDPAHFRADSFAQLAVSPILAGRFQDSFFTVEEMNVRVVIDGATSTFDSRLFLQGLERLMNRAVALFETIPAEDYLFILHFSDTRLRAGTGSCATTALFWDQHAREEDLDPLLREATASFLRSWLGGRIRPRTDGDPLLEPAVVESLWFLEGAAAYYADLLLTRSGLIPPDEFLARVSDRITALQNSPAREIQSAIAASEQIRYRAWAEYRSPERSLDPRLKGYVLSFLLDLEMRDASDNQRSLDDLMGFMTAWFGRGGKPYADSAEIIRAAGALAGTDLTPFYTRFVAGTDELPCDEIVAAAGWEVRRVAIETAIGGFDVEPEGPEALIVTGVEEHAPAARAGLRPGDRITIANGHPAALELSAILARARPGETLTLTIQRRMTEETIAFELGRGNRQGYLLETLPEADPRQRAIATGLLSGLP